MAFAVWITGLPGSGKSSIAKELAALLGDVEYLRLDELRKKYVREPKFTDDERDTVYRKFVEDASSIVRKGKNVILDATAYKLTWRDEARKTIKDFLEVYVSCPVERCADRESKRKEGLVTSELYRKALERKRSGKQFEGLGQVVGVDVDFQVNVNAEVKVDSGILEPKEAARVIFDEINKRGWM